MFSLRDLIFSQSQQSQSSYGDPQSQPFDYDGPQEQQDGHVDRGANSSSHTKRSTWHYHDLPATVGGSSAMPYVDGDYFTDEHSRKRVRPFLGTLPMTYHINDMPTLYREASEVKHARRDKDDAYEAEYSHKYAPGLYSYTRFRQSDVFEASLRRQMLAVLANDCYYAKDHAGAMMVLSTMTEVSAMEFPHLVLLVKTLIEMRDGASYVEQLMHALVRQTHSRHRFHRSRELLLLSEAFITLNDVSAVQELLQSRFSDPSFTRSSTLLGLNALLLCQKAIALADEILKILPTGSCSEIYECYGILKLPTSKEIVQFPFKFAVCVKVLSEKGPKVEQELRSVGSQRSQPSIQHARDLQINCRKVLSDLKGALLSAASAQSPSDSSSLHTLCVAFYDGCGQHDRAWHYITDWAAKLPSIASPLSNNGTISWEPTSVHACLCRSVVEYIATLKLRPIFGLLSTNRRLPAALNHVLSTFLGLLSHLATMKTPGNVNIDLILAAVSMNQLNVLSDKDLACALCDAIESCPLILMQPMNGENVGHACPSGSNRFHWFMWRSLAMVLGPTCTRLVDTDSPLEPHSDLYPYFQNAPRNSFEYLKRHCEENQRDGTATKVDNFFKLEKEIRPFIALPVCDRTAASKSLQDRYWWAHTVLSAFQLGDSLEMPIVTVETANQIIDHLPEDVTALTELADPLNLESSNEDPWLASPNADHNFDPEDVGIDAVGDELHHLFKIPRIDVQLSENAIGIIRRLVHQFSENTSTQLLADLRSDGDSQYCITFSSRHSPAVDKSAGFKYTAVVLGDKLLEILSFQIIASCHLHQTQDSLFAVRGIEILFEHAIAASATATAGLQAPTGAITPSLCLGYLKQAGINLLRAVQISRLLANYSNASTYAPTPPIYGSDLRIQSISYFGNPAANSYKPHYNF